MQHRDTPEPSRSLPVLPNRDRLSLPAIDPHRLGQGVLERAVGVSAEYSDLTTIAFYNIGRRIVNDSGLGTHYTNDVLGCNHRCAHCWVHTDALNGDASKTWTAHKKELFPKRFRGEAVQEADDVFDYLVERVTRLPNMPHVVGFGGGEPLQYRGGLRRFAERAQRLAGIDPVTISVDTTGFLVAEDRKYLDAFEGLEETMHFYVSVKGVTPGSFQRFTGVRPEYHEHAFTAMKRLLERGFPTVPGGVVLDTFFHAQEFSSPLEPIALLHEKLSAIHPEYPAALAYHKVTFGMVHEPRRQSERMQSRGYHGSSPKEFGELLVRYFEEKGTPIIAAQPENRGVPGIVAKRGLLRRVIADLQER